MIRNSVIKSIESLIALIGIVSNTLAIIVFERKQLKKCSYSIYWKTRACFDIWLLLHTFRHWSRHFLNFDIDIVSPVFCRFNEYQPYVAGGTSLCLESLITLDRYFTIVCPNRLKIVKQRRFQIAAISLIFVYNLLLPIRFPLNYRLDEINGTVICHVRRQVIEFNWIVYLANVVIVNIIINPILDLKIIYHIVSKKRKC